MGPRADWPFDTDGPPYERSGAVSPGPHFSPCRIRFENGFVEAADVAPRTAVWIDLEQCPARVLDFRFLEIRILEQVAQREQQLRLRATNDVAEIVFVDPRIEAAPDRLSHAGIRIIRTLLRA